MSLLQRPTAIRDVTTDDIEILHPVFETWIRDSSTGLILPDEIAQLESDIRGTIDGNRDKRYFIAQDAGGVALGIMGVQSPPDERIDRFVATSRPVETINAYVADSQRSQGTGRLLAGYIEKIAKTKGYSELLVNSGPRYKDTGWPFWTNLYGPAVGKAIGLYGEGRDAMVWRKILSPEEASRVITLPTERDCVVLRSLSCAADDEAYFSGVEEKRSHLSRFGDRTSAKYQKLQDVADARLAVENKIRLGIWDGVDFRGMIAARPQDDEHSVEVGYWLRASATGQGYATIAVKAITEYLAADYERVFAKVHEDNFESQAVLQRSSYVATGRSKEDWGPAIIFDARED